MMRSWFSKPTHRDSTDLPLYKRRAHFLRDSERVLLEALQQVVGQAYQILAKVKLSELVEPQVESGNRVHQMHWIKVHRQCVDLLICRRRDMEPMIAVRLLNKTEYARRGLTAYDIIDIVLRDIGLPRLTLVEKKSYDAESLKKKLKIAMAENQDGETTPIKPGPRKSTHGAGAS